MLFVIVFNAAEERGSQYGLDYIGCYGNKEEGVRSDDYDNDDDENDAVAMATWKREDDN